MEVLVKEEVARPLLPSNNHLLFLHNFYFLGDDIFEVKLMIVVETAEQFQTLIEQKPTLVDFFATWCNPCKMLAPILDQTEDSFSELNFLKVDVDKLNILASKYQVSSIPTLILFDQGQPVQRHIGFIPQAQLIEWLKTWGK